MKAQYIQLIQTLVSVWHLKRPTATLLATALFASARSNNEIGKTAGILMAYNAAGLIGENTYQKAQGLLADIAGAKTEEDAITAITEYFRED